MPGLMPEHPRFLRSPDAGNGSGGSDQKPDPHAVNRKFFEELRKMISEQNLHRLSEQPLQSENQASLGDQLSPGELAAIGFGNAQPLSDTGDQSPSTSRSHLSREEYLKKEGFTNENSVVLDSELQQRLRAVDERERRLGPPDPIFQPSERPITVDDCQWQYKKVHIIDKITK